MTDLTIAWDTTLRAALAARLSADDSVRRPADPGREALMRAG